MDSYDTRNVPCPLGWVFVFVLEVLRVREMDSDRTGPNGNSRHPTINQGTTLIGKISLVLMVPRLGSFRPGVVSYHGKHNTEEVGLQTGMSSL